MTELTKREQFVKEAMGAFLTDPRATRQQFASVAKVSVEVADLVLSELEKPKFETGLKMENKEIQNRRCDVFKKTTDKWYPNYPGDVVKVSFITLNLSSSAQQKWRVCVRGVHDYGLEKTFFNDWESWAEFLWVIRLDDVTQRKLRERDYVEI